MMKLLESTVNHNPGTMSVEVKLDIVADTENGKQPANQHPGLQKYASEMIGSKRQ